MGTAKVAERISALKFMRYLFASLVMERNVIIDKAKLVETIFDFKSKVSSDLIFIFDDIEFRKGIDSIVSPDIDASINNLQTFGVVGKLNPTYEKMVIYLTEADAGVILDSCEPSVREALGRLAMSLGR